MIEINKYRKKLGLEPWDTIPDTPFSESLREYCRLNNQHFHLEAEYDRNKVTLYMSVENNYVMDTCHITNISWLEDDLAKRIIN